MSTLAASSLDSLFGLTKLSFTDENASIGWRTPLDLWVWVLITFPAQDSTDSTSVFTNTSGLSGSSYGALIPATCSISPRWARSNRPRVSRAIRTSIGARQYTSTKPTISSRRASRTSRYGETAVTTDTTPLRFSILHS